MQNPGQYTGLLLNTGCPAVADPTSLQFLTHRVKMSRHMETCPAQMQSSNPPLCTVKALCCVERPHSNRLRLSAAFPTCHSHTQPTDQRSAAANSLIISSSPTLPLTQSPHNQRPHATTANSNPSAHLMERCCPKLSQHLLSHSVRDAPVARAALGCKTHRDEAGDAVQWSQAHQLLQHGLWSGFACCCSGLCMGTGSEVQQATQHETPDKLDELG